jgi:repressor LexA
MKGLTKRQLEVLSFIENYINTHKFSPSYREIMKHFEFSSIGSVSKHIYTLKRKGFLDNEKQCSRSLKPKTFKGIGNPDFEVELPYIGYISANIPIETFPQSQKLAVPLFLVPNPRATYVLRARGNSLNDEMISDGDLLLVEPRTEVYDGETILANASHHKTLIKKYHPEGNYVRLASHSSQIPSVMIRYEDLQIQGILVSLLRLYP